MIDTPMAAGIGLLAGLSVGIAVYHFVAHVASLVNRETAAALIEARLTGASGAGLAAHYLSRGSRIWRQSKMRRYAAESLRWAGHPEPEPLLLKAFLLLLGVFFLSSLFFGSALKGFGMALLVSVIGVFWQSRRSRVRLNLFAEQLPGLIASISSGLAAGLSLRQALENSAEEAQYPAREELVILSEQVSLGLPLDDALDGLRRRLPLPELDALSLGLAIQRRSGGNIVELLRGIGQSIETKRRLLGNLRVETAQARMSAGIIGSMPVLVGLGTGIVDPSFMAPMLMTESGLIMTGIAVALEIGGFVLLRRISGLEI